LGIAIYYIVSHNRLFGGIGAIGRIGFAKNETVVEEEIKNHGNDGSKDKGTCGKSELI
jgi:hypothetical protein